MNSLDKTSLVKHKITFIDLFAGAGGLSEGFINSGYFPIAHVEMDVNACNTLKTRTSFHYLNKLGRLNVYREYLTGKMTREELFSFVPTELLDCVINETMSECSLGSIYNQIDHLMVNQHIVNVDLIVGGPPCQAYSLVGRARKDMGLDPRNDLYKLYCNFLQKYKPKMFVFENVPGLLTARNGKLFQQIREELKAAGYEIDYRVLDAADFGILQKRKRVVIVGWESGSKKSYPVFIKVEHTFTVKDLLNDLPKIFAGQRNEQYRTKRINKYLILTGIRKPEDVLTWHVARKHTDQDLRIYRKAIRQWNINKQRLRYSDLPRSLATHKNKTGFLDRFKVVAANLSACHTLMAHICKDGHYYIHPDIKQARSITVREAARIQSFSDSYYFEGSRTAAFRQVGNAVPPMMAKCIADALALQLIKNGTT